MDSKISSSKDDSNYISPKIVDIYENSSKFKPTIISNLRRNFQIFYNIIKYILIITGGIFLYFIFINQKKSIKQLKEHILKEQKHLSMILSKMKYLKLIKIF